MGMLIDRATAETIPRVVARTRPRWANIRLVVIIKTAKKRRTKFIKVSVWGDICKKALTA
jgi:hypothetical protein